MLKKALKTTAVTAGLSAGALYVLARRSAAPRYRGPLSDHFDGERFLNRNQGPHGFGSFLRWVATREKGVWPAWIDSTPAPPPLSRSTAPRVTFVNHSTVLIQLDGMNILTDPVWSERASPVQFAGPKRHRAPGVNFDDLPPIDVVVLSHNHYDHLDLPTLLRLRDEHDPVFFVPLGNSAYLEEAGIERTNDLDWWEGVELAPSLRLSCVPAEHFSGRGVGDRDATLWCGWVLTTPSGSIYFAGDTGFGEHFAEIGQRFAPLRLAMLPIGAFLPLWFMKPVHISPHEAVRAHQALGAQKSMAIHFGCFALGDDGFETPLIALTEAREVAGISDEAFVVLEEGASLEL